MRNSRSALTDLRADIQLADTHAKVIVRGIETIG